MSILLVFLQRVASAQEGQTKSKPGTAVVSQNAILGLTGTKGNPTGVPLSFARELNADTVLASNTVFKEVIDLNSWSDAKADFSTDIDGTVLIRRSFRKDTFVIKKMRICCFRLASIMKSRSGITSMYTMM